MSRKKQDIFKVSVIYILISLINKSIGIITIPVFTRILTKAEMGLNATWISWMTLLLPITSLSLCSGSLAIAMNEYKEERDEYQSSALFLSSLATSIFFIIYLIFRKVLNPIFTLDTPLMIFMFVYLIFSPALDMWLLRQRYEYNVKKMSLISISSNMLAALVPLFLVLIFRDKEIDLGIIRIYATYCVLIVFSILLYLSIIKKGKTLFDKKYWKFGLMLSIPLIFHTLAKNIIDSSDRVMISMFCGKEEVGIYGTVYSLSTLSLIVWTAINNAFVPYLYENIDSKDERIKNNLINISYFLVMFFAVTCIGATAVAPELVSILTTSDYYEAIYIIPPVAAGIYLTCIYNLFGNIILYHKKSSYVMIATSISAGLNLVLNYIFISKFGYMAAAYTTLVAYILLALLQGIMMKKVHKDKFYNMKILLLISIIVIGVSLSFLFMYKNWILRYLIISLIFVVVFIKRRYIIQKFMQIRNKEVV